MSSFMNRDEIIVKSGWMYRQKTVLQKRWKRKWMVLLQDGRVHFQADSDSKTHGRTWDLKQDCMYLWDEKHCHHVLPPRQSTSTCLMELLFVGNTRLTLCALTEADASYWYQALERGRLETRSVSRQTSLGAIVEEGEENKDRSWCCWRVKINNRVREINYRPATQGQSRRKSKKRRVSWNDNITMISP